MHNEEIRNEAQNVCSFHFSSGRVAFHVSNSNIRFLRMHCTKVNNNLLRILISHKCLKILKHFP